MARSTTHSVTFSVRLGILSHACYNGAMRALVKTSAGPGLTYTDRPDPAPGPSDAVIHIKATSLCGTDAHIYNWDAWAHSRIHPPRTIGHEMCGEVVEVGSDVTLVKVGDYVAAESHLTCGACFQCRTGQAHVCKNYRILGVDRDGSFADYVVFRKLCSGKPRPTFRRNSPPPGTPRQRRGRRSGRRPDRTDGLDHRLRSDRTFRRRRRTQRPALPTIIATDVSDYRLGWRNSSASITSLNAKTDRPDLIAAAIRDITGGEGVDASLEMSGNPTGLHHAFQSVKNGGRVTLFGIPTGPLNCDLANDIIFKGHSSLWHYRAASVQYLVSIGRTLQGRTQYQARHHPYVSAERLRPRI